MNLLQPDYSLMLATLAAFVVPLAIVAWIAVRLLRRTREPRAHPEARAGEQERLVALAERIESVAEDTRRLEEAQRFTTELLAARAGVTSGTGKPAV